MKSALPGPLKVAFWQCALSVVMALLWWVRSTDAAVSALLGGAVIAGPNMLFALRLWRAEFRQDGYVFAFFLGEFIKVLLSIVLMGLVAALYTRCDWLAFLVSMIAIMQVYLVGLWFTAPHGASVKSLSD
jgi:ATP synthase protein I